MISWYWLPTTLMIGFCACFVAMLWAMPKGQQKIIAQRNELIRLSTAVVREHRFKGYAMVPSYSLGSLKRYLEGLK